MVSRQIDAMAELQSAFRALTKNWILAVPTGIAAIVATAFLVFVVLAAVGSIAGAGMLGGNYHPGAAGALLGAGGLTFVIGGIICFLVFILAYATVMAGAENVWRGQPADLGAGLSKAFGRLGPLIGLFIIAVIVGIICGLLVIALGLGIILGILLGFFWMYALPAIVVGNEGTMQALSTSYRLVRSNLSASITAFLGIVVVSIIGEIIIRIFHFLPALSLIIAFIVGGFTYAYSALVAVRFYDLLRSQPAAVTPVSGTTV